MVKLLLWITKLLITLLVLSVLWVIIYKFVPVPYTALMGIRSYETGETIQHKWVSIDEIPAQLQLAVICAEDQNFTSHKGFDEEAIKKAWTYNKQGGKVRGASTISQQTSKNVFLWPARSWLRKGLEAYFTLLIEMFWSKERILEVYLNSIEMGPGVFGAEAASIYWFQKPVAKLSKREAAALAAVLPNPRVYKANPPTAYISQRINWIVKQMDYYGPFSLTPETPSHGHK